MHKITRNNLEVKIFFMHLQQKKATATKYGKTL